MTSGLFDDTRPLVLSNRIAIEEATDQGAVIFDTTTQQRLRISPPVLSLIRKFTRPAAPAAVLDAAERPRLASVLQSLIARRVLLDTAAGRSDRVEPPESPRTTAWPTMFRAPARGRRGPRSDVAILGFPYDAGNIVKPGARKGPEAIRRRSYDQEYRVEASSGRPLGWFEVDTQERLLEGVTFADWGDVRVVYGEDPERLWGRARAACQEVLDAGALPVVLGGDHSISYPFVDAIQQTTPLHVIWLDAHTDYAELPIGASHNHKNVLRRVSQLPNITGVLHIGHRGYTSSDKVNRRPPQVEMVTSAELRRNGPTAALERLPPGAPCYVSIDIDVLDAIYAPATSTPAVNGPSPDQIKALLRMIGAHADVRGITSSK